MQICRKLAIWKRPIESGAMRVVNRKEDDEYRFLADVATKRSLYLNCSL